LRATCVTHASVGCAVIPARRTRANPTQRIKACRAGSGRRLAVKKSVASVPAARRARTRPS
jgi:hypothetical protein